MPAANRANFRVKVGFYTGDGVDSRNITEVGFMPDVVFIFCTTAGSTQNKIIRLFRRIGDSSGFISSTNQNLSNYIQQMRNDGFQLGTQAQVNAAANTYAYLAIKGDRRVIRSGEYIGDGADNRNFTDSNIAFTPDLALIQQYNTGQSTVIRLSNFVGDLTMAIGNDFTTAADMIQSLIANGFQLGTNARVNTAATKYLYLAMKIVEGAFQIGQFVGSGVQRSITGVGFKPDFVLVRNKTTNGLGARVLTKHMVENFLNSVYVGTTAPAAGGIVSLDEDGFTVGTDSNANAAGADMQWIAFKSGDFNIPLLSRSAA